MFLVPYPLRSTRAEAFAESMIHECFGISISYHSAESRVNAYGAITKRQVASTRKSNQTLACLDGRILYS